MLKLHLIRSNKNGQSHIVPVNTKIMNHHIIHHTYVPMYTCCEEDTCCNVYDNKCGMM